MTTELFGDYALIIFIMVDDILRICDNYSHRNVTRTLCTRLSRFCFVFTYESQPSVSPVEQKQKHLEADTLPESRWQPMIKTSLPENKEYIASFYSSFRISSDFHRLRQCM